MKKFHWLSFLALTIGHVATSGAASFYNNDNYGDHHATVYAGPTSYTQSFAGFNDDMSSLKVFAGECVYLARDANFSGSKLILPAGDYPSLSAYGWNDKVSSYIVYNPVPGFSCEQSVAYWYKDGSLGGRAYPAPNGITMVSVGNFNDDASSIDVPPAVCVIGFKSDGFTGGSLKFVYGGGIAPWNDAMSSFTVWSYNHPNCTGS